MTKCAKNQNLEESRTFKRNQVGFQDRKNENTPNFPSIIIYIMILGSIPTPLKINFRTFFIK